jgi:hypothetical protein
LLRWKTKPVAGFITGIFAGSMAAVGVSLLPYPWNKMVWVILFMSAFIALLLEQNKRVVEGKTNGDR